MLWYKSWMETRWRFLIGLAVLMLSAASTVLVFVGRRIRHSKRVRNGFGGRPHGGRHFGHRPAVDAGWQR
jgi:hypothetical protein